MDPHDAASLPRGPALRFGVVDGFEVDGGDVGQQTLVTVPEVVARIGSMQVDGDDLELVSGGESPEAVRHGDREPHAIPKADVPRYERHAVTRRAFSSDPAFFRRNASMASATAPSVAYHPIV